MARRNRIIFEGAIYHIYQRGNNKEYVFQNDKIKSFILRCLKEYNKKLDYEVLAYVIMNNHYHLLIKTNKSPINEVMFYINNLLGKYINNELNRTGHAFEGRYKCKVVDTDSYLIWLLRYIHRNPIKANICSELEDYYWSSHYYYKNKIQSHINTGFILSMLGNNRSSAINKYLKIVHSVGDETDNTKDYEIIKDAFDLNESSFLNNNCDVDNPIRANRKTLNDIILELNINEDTITYIRNGSRKQALTPVKVAIIERALMECYSLKEIAKFINAAPSTISKLISRNRVL